MSKPKYRYDNYDTQQNTQVRSVQLPSIKNELMASAVSIITASELNQIKAHISLSETNPTKKMDSQRLWAQRIQNQRNKREKEKYEKFIVEEEERRRVDKLEEEYQQELKNEQIRDANQKIFNSKADVRGLKSKMLVSEIESTNQELVNIKKEYQAYRNEAENQLNYEMQYKLEKQIEEEQEHQQKQEEKKKATYEQLAIQHKEVREKLIKAYIREMQEGALIHQKAIDDELLTIQQKEENKEKQKRWLKEQHAQMEAKLQKAREIQLEEEKEERKRQKYDDHKVRIVEMRKEREELKKVKQHKIRKTIYDLRVTQMKKQDDVYTYKMQKQQEEQRAKEDQIFQAKELEKAQLIQQSEASRLQQLEYKQNQQQIQQQERSLEHEQKIKALKALEDMQISQQNILKKRNKELQNFQKLQIEQKQQQRKNEFAQELKDYKLIRSMEEEEKGGFKTWAQQCIDEWQDSGKNVLPMLASLQKAV